MSVRFFSCVCHTFISLWLVKFLSIVTAQQQPQPQQQNNHNCSSAETK